jgi:carboxyl-terminal processing protease
LDRAVIVGAQSFGKGLVQRPKPLVYGTQMKITISRYYTPSGRCIQALDYWHRDENGKATRVNRENYNVFKTKKGRNVYDGGGVQPDLELESSNYSAITKAILDEHLIFDFATQYYYDHKVTDWASFNFNDTDFSEFKSFLKDRNFNFETKTGKAFDDALNVAIDEKIVSGIETEYNALLSALNNYKTKAIDDNKTQLVSLLSDEIIKRYFYREGLYEYYIAHNPEIQKGVEILKSPVKYSGFLE